METESWLASKPQTPSVSKGWPFVVALGSESTVHKHEMFEASSTPTAFFLLFTVLGGRIDFVSECPFARKEKQVWPVENLIVLIPPFMLLRR